MLWREVLGEGVNRGGLTIVFKASVRERQFLNLNHRLCVYEQTQVVGDVFFSLLLDVEIAAEKSIVINESCPPLSDLRPI